MKSIRFYRFLSLFLTALALGSTTASHAQVRVVNIIPNSRSSETVIDSEPNLTVNPANVLQMAASAFTPDPMGANAPYYTSTDGGNTWDLRFRLPGNNSTYGTNDITLRFGGTSGILYIGMLRGDAYLRLNILRTNDYTNTTPLTPALVDRFNVDQPYVQSTTVLGGEGLGHDRVYIGNNNNLNSSITQTATVDRTLDAATTSGTAGFSPFVLEARSTAGQDGPPIRTAIHADGTVYGVFYRWTSESGDFSPFATITADVVVVRADAWGTSSTPFNPLSEPAMSPGDGLVGQRVVTGRTVPWANTAQASFGQARFVGSNLSIAVDPTNSNRVYVAWADRVSTSDYTLHVRRSETRGAGWSGDLLTITNATNPALAINTKGKIGFLYQQLTGSGTSQRWQTHLQRSTDGMTWVDMILADTPAGSPVVTTGMYLGDYVHLQAIGKDFYGIFPANNTPVLTNFPQGVTYQRNVNWTTNTLLPFLGTGTVSASVDPFFFQVTETPPASDFYVRDWSQDSTTFDTGLEPSTNPWFFINSDVWNQRNNVMPSPNSGGFFDHDNPRNGAGAAGDNFAFARVSRKAASTGTADVDVSLHFLYANFGAGLNYVDAGTAMDPTLTFSPGATQAVMTTGYPWHLDPTTSTHLCIGVQITAPGDDFVPPSLAGSAPGWPTTDLRIINDNNKAQRNMEILPTGTGAPGSASGYAIVHNAASFSRDMTLRYEASPDVQERLRDARIEMIGGRARPFKSGDTITFENMQPGENRWIGITFNASVGKEGETLPVSFLEMVGNAPVNGFAIALRPSKSEEVIRYNLELHRSVFSRLAALFEIEGAKEQAAEADHLLRDQATEASQYTQFLQKNLEALQAIVERLDTRQKNQKLFGTQEALKALSRTLHSGETARAGTAHLSLLNKLDSATTMAQLAQGDPADILQNVRWQVDLYSKSERLKALPESREIVKRSEDFIQGYLQRRIGNSDYLYLIRELKQSFGATAKALGQLNLQLEADIDEMERNLNSLPGLQRAHRGFLLKLSSLKGPVSPIRTREYRQ